MPTHPNDAYICTHLGDDYEQFHGAVVPPIYINTLHVFPTVEAMWERREDDPYSFSYGRNSNPTVAIAERKIAALERTEAALCFGSGMAALTSAMLSVLTTGSHVVAVRNIYGPAYNFLTGYAPRLGIEASFVSGESLDEIERALRPNTRLIYLESPSTFMFTLQDLAAVAQLAKARGIRTMIDNTWCTPLYQKPAELGVDLVCHTLSKYLGGHSDVIGGCIAGSRELISGIAKQERLLLGGILGPMEGSLVLRGLRTLPQRLRHHEQSAITVARMLEGHPKVRRVLHPGLPSHPQYALGQKQMTGSTGLFAYEVDLTTEQTVRYINALKLFKIGVSWGGFESLALCPLVRADDEHLAFLNAPRTLVRMHVGLEDVNDLMNDIEQAFGIAVSRKDDRP